jgi:hypothetical protein
MPDLPNEINLVAWVSILGGIYSIIWAYHAFKKIYEIFLDAEIREHAAFQVNPAASKP